MPNSSTIPEKSTMKHAVDSPTGVCHIDDSYHSDDSSAHVPMIAEADIHPYLEFLPNGPISFEDFERHITNLRNSVSASSGGPEREGISILDAVKTELLSPVFGRNLKRAASQDSVDTALRASGTRSAMYQIAQPTIYPRLALNILSAQIQNLFRTYVCSFSASGVGAVSTITVPDKCVGKALELLKEIDCKVRSSASFVRLEQAKQKQIRRGWLFNSHSWVDSRSWDESNSCDDSSVVDLIKELFSPYSDSVVDSDTALWLFPAILTDYNLVGAKYYWAYLSWCKFRVDDINLAVPMAFLPLLHRHDEMTSDFNHVHQLMHQAYLFAYDCVTAMLYAQRRPLLVEDPLLTECYEFVDMSGLSTYYKSSLPLLTFKRYAASEGQDLLISSTEQGSVFLPLTVREMSYSSVVVLGQDKFVVAPWHTCAKVERNGDRLNFKTRNPTNGVWSLVFTVLLAIMPGAAAATPVEMNTRSLAATGIAAFILFWLLRLLKQKYPRLRRVINVLLDEESERSIGPIEAPPVRNPFSKPVRKFEAAPYEQDLPSKLEHALEGAHNCIKMDTEADRRTARRWHGESDWVLAMFKMRLTLTMLIRRTFGSVARHYRHDLEKYPIMTRERAMLEDLMAQDEQFKDEILTGLAWGWLSAKFVYPSMHSEIAKRRALLFTTKIATHSVRFSKALRKAGWCVTQHIHTVSMPTQSIFSWWPSRKTVAKTLDHPVFDLCLCLHRALMTPWLSNASANTLLSAALEFSKIMYRLYEILPKTRIALFRQVLELVGAKNVFQGDGATLKPEEDSSWLSIFKMVAIDWPTARTAVKWGASKLLALTALLPTLWAPFTDKQSFSEALLHVASDLKKHTLISSVIDAVFDLVEGSVFMLATGSLGGAFHRPFARVEDSYSALKIRSDNFASSQDADGIQLLSELGDLAEEYKVLRCKARNLAEERHVTDRVVAIDVLRKNVCAVMDAAKSAYAPRAVGLSGPPGTGKSVAINAIIDVWSQAIGIKPRIGIINEDDEYDSQLSPYHNIAKCEDVGKNTEKFCKNPIAASIIRFCTPNQVPLVKAEVTGKTGLFSHLVMIAVTGNHMGLRMNVGITDYGAVTRRLIEYHATPNDEAVYEENSRTYRPKEDQLIMEPTHLNFQRVVNMEGSTAWGPTLKGPKMSWFELQSVLKEEAILHDKRQKHVLLAKTMDRGRCPHGLYKVNCSSCTAIGAEFEASLPVRLVVDQVNRNLMSFSELWLSSLVLLDDEALYARAGSNVFISLLSVFGIVIAAMFTNNVHCCLFCTFMAARALANIVACAGAFQRKQVIQATGNELREVAENNPHYTGVMIMGGVSLIGCLFALRRAKRLAFEGANDDLTEGQMATVRENVSVVEKAKDGTPVTVKEVKEVLKIEEHVIEEFKEKTKREYWNTPHRVYPVSTSGSGAREPDTLDRVDDATYYLVESTTKGGRKRIVTQWENGKLLMNKHYLPGLVDGSQYYVVRRFPDGQLFTQVIRYDAASTVVGPEGTDLCILRTSPIRGGCKHLLSYAPETILSSTGNEGVRFKPGPDWTIVREKCYVTLRPDEEILIDKEIHRGVFHLNTVTPTQKGDCGGLVVVNKTIVGIHSYGLGLGINSGSGGSLLRRPLLSVMLKHSGTFSGSDVGPKLSYRSKEVELVDEHPKNPTNFVGLGNVLVYGHFDRKFSLRTQLQPNEYAELFGKLIGTELKDTYAPARGSFNKIAHKTLSLASAYKGEGSFAEFRAATDDYLRGMPEVVRDVLDRNPSFLRHPMGWTSAIWGLNEHFYEHGIDQSKSAGFPWNTKKGSMILDTNYELRCGRLEDRFEHDLIDVLCELRKHNTTGLIGNSLGKDEPLPFKTITKLGETISALKEKRSFVGCNFLMHVIAKMWLGPIMAIMQEAHLFFCNSVGIDPGSTEWHELMEFIRDGIEADQERFLSIDQESYDLTHHAALDESLVRVFVAVANELDYTDDDILIVQIILNEMMQMYVNFSGPIVKVGLWPSGILPTAIGGATKTVIQFIAMANRQFPGEYFRDYMRVTALGDDNLSSIKPGHDLLNTTKLKADYVSTGMSITSDSKTDAIAYTTLLTSGYLSRTPFFHPDLNRWVGALREASMTRPYVVRKKTEKVGELMSDIATSVMREAALHGRDKYNLFAHANTELFKHMGYPIPVAVSISYDDYIEIIKERDAVKRVRYRYEGDMLEPTVGAEQKVETRQLEEPGELTSVEEIAHVEASTHRERLPTRELPPFINREVLAFQESVTKDFQFSYRFNPLKSIMDSPFIASRMSTYSAIKATIVVRFSITGTKFHYGSFIAHTIYRPSLLDFQNEAAMPHNIRMVLSSQRNPVYFHLGEGEVVAELEVPYFSEHAFLRLNSGSVNDYCNVVVESITPMRCAVDDSDNDVTLFGYARLKDVQVLGHVPRTYFGAPEEGRAKPSTIIGRAARLADAVARIPGMSVPASIASGVLHGASDLARAAGFSRPIQFETGSYVPFATSGTANANTDIAGRVVSYDVHQGVSLDPNIGPFSKVEELSIKSLVSKEVIIRTGTIPVASEGVDFLHVNVTPAIELYDGRNGIMTSHGLVSSMRRYWHGVMKYKLRILTTGLMGGKIRVRYNADGDEATASLETVDSFLFDLKATHEVEVEVNWMSYRNFLLTFDNGLSNVFGSYDTRRNNGSLSFSVQQRLVGTTVDQKVDFVLSAWMEDEVFINPDYGVIKKREFIPELENSVGPRIRFLTGEFPDAIEVAEDEETLPPSTSFPLTNAPTPALGGESESAAPTSASTIRTEGPTVQPSVASNSPTIRPSFLPSIFSSKAPTKVPTPAFDCTALEQVSVPFEWLAARAAIRPSSGGSAVMLNTDVDMRILMRSTRTAGGAKAVVELSSTTDVSNRSPNVTFNGNTMEIASTSLVDGFTKEIGDVTSASAVTVNSVTVTLPIGMYVREWGPDELAAEFGARGVPVQRELAPGVLVRAWQLEQDLTLIARAPTGPCAVSPYGVVALAGRFVTSTGASLLGNIYFSERYDDRITIRRGGVVFGVYTLEYRASFEADLPGDTTKFVIGTRLNKESELVAVHAGEDIISLRQDLKVFRQHARVTNSGSFNYSAHVHAYDRTELEPFNFLQHCFAAQRGGMTAWYILDGDGRYYVERGTGRGGRDALQRGFEYTDTRVNPSLVVTFPWMSSTRYDYARNNLPIESSDCNRVVWVQPRAGSGPVTLIEHLCVAEDFTFLHFMGAPLMRRT